MSKDSEFNLNFRLGLLRAKSTLGSYSKLMLFVLLVSLSSCYTSKQVDYLQSDKQKLRIPVIATKYKVQPNDVLSVKVQSRDPEQTQFFNTSAIENNNLEANPASLYLTGYTVDNDGIINLAIVGSVKVSALTVEEIRDKIQLKIDKYLVNATVSVKLTSFKVSVMGDVKSPGTYYIYNTQATIFEALSQGGDLNISAKRKNVKLIRQNGDESIVVSLDLTDPSVIQSPYYFLHPNDVIYVDTSKPRLVQNNLGVLTLILTAVSTTVLILNFTNK